MKTKASKLTPFLFLIFMAVSVYAGNNKLVPHPTNWLPKDFDSRKTVMLVQIYDYRGRYSGEHTKETEQMKAMMAERYHYKFEFATKKEIEESDKYEDKEKYRYALKWENQGQGVDFFILDRKTENAFPRTGIYNSRALVIFEPALNTIVDRLKSLK